MNVFYKLFARSYLGRFKLAIPFLSYHNPIIYDYDGMRDTSIPSKEKFQLFMDYLDKFEEQLGIDKTINCFKESDIDGMAKYALKEANPLYSVPVMLDLKKWLVCTIKFKGNNYDKRRIRYFIRKSTGFF